MPLNMVRGEHKSCRVSTCFCTELLNAAKIAADAFMGKVSCAGEFIGDSYWRVETTESVDGFVGKKDEIFLNFEV